MTRHSPMHRDYLRRLAALQDLTTELAGMGSLMTEAHNAAAMLLNSGVASDSGDEFVSGGGTSDPTLNALFTRAWVQDHLGAVDQLLATLARAAGELNAELTPLIASARQASGEDEMPQLLDTVDCTACGTRISRQGNDRPISGYCRACYEAWRRLGRAHEGPGAPDRAAFERARRDMTAPARVVADRRRVTHLTIGGRQVALSEVESAELTAHGDALPQDVVDDLVARLRLEGRVPV